MTKIGDDPKPLITDPRAVRELEPIAELDGYASVVSDVDLDVLADPRASGDRQITVRDFTRRFVGDDITRESRAQGMLNALADHLPRDAGVTIRRTRSGNVRSIDLPARARDTSISEADAQAIEARFEARGGTSVRQYYAADPRCCETLTVPKVDEGALAEAFANGYRVVGSETREAPGAPLEHVAPEEMSASFGDLFSTGAYSPDPDALEEVTRSLAEMRVEGFELDALTVHSGTDAEPVSAELYGQMFDEFLAPDDDGVSALERLGFESPYGDEPGYSEIYAELAAGNRDAVIDRLRSIEALEPPRADLAARYGGEASYDGNILLGFARNARVREALLDHEALGLSPDSFAAPVIQPSVRGPSGGERNPQARHVALDFERNRERLERTPQSEMESELTLARYEPTRELPSELAVVFDISSSISEGEKALFLERVHDALAERGHDEVAFEVVVMDAEGYRDTVRLRGSPGDVVLALAGRPQVLGDTMRRPDLGAIRELAGRGERVRLDTSLGEYNGVALRVSRALERLGPDAEVLVFTDTDDARMSAFKAPPYSWRFYNPAYQ